MSKEVLISYYNNKYKFDDNKKHKLNKITFCRYPKNRYEVAVYWGRGTGRALEVGAGDGQILSFLCDYYEEYIATELSIERVRYLEAMFGESPNVIILQNDIEEKKLSFSSEYFDTIIMVAVIEHLIEPVSVIKYCYSLLKPGGRILIYTPNFAKWTRRLKLLFGLFPSTASIDEGFLTYEGYPTDFYDEGHLHYFTFRSLEKLLKEKVGFKKVKYCPHGRTLLSRVLPRLFSECFVIGVK